MKQKTTFITLALVVAVLALGVAYASITTQTLNVAGTATAEASNDNFNVNFVGQPTHEVSAKVGENSNTATVTAGASGKSGTFTVSGMDTEGEYVIIKFPIVNSSPDLAAVLSNVKVENTTLLNTDDAWWSVEANLEAPTTLDAATGTTNLVVKVTLNDTPANNDEAPEGKFHVTFDADPA